MTPRVAAAVEAELAFARELRALDAWPAGDDLRALIERYNAVDLECQRAGDDATREDWAPLSAAMLAARDEEHALGQRSVLVCASNTIELLRADLETVRAALLDAFARTGYAATT